MFRRAPSRGGRGRRVAVDFVVCFRWGGFFRVFFLRFIFFLERTQPAASMWPPCLIYLYTSAGVRTGCHNLICLCVTFVVFAVCESCARPISTNPGTMNAGEYELTHGTCFVALRPEVVAVAGLL